MRESELTRAGTAPLGLAALLLAAALAAAALSLSPVGLLDRFSSDDTAATMRPAPTSSSLRRLPLQAQGVISTVLGEGAPAFAARPHAGGYRLQGGGVAAMLTGHGVRVTAPGGAVGMHLTNAAPRRGGQLAAHGNRVTRSWAGACEWYAAGPLGIEQGFVVTRRAPGRARQLTLRLALTGHLSARARAGRVLFLRRGRPAFEYGGISAVDARGRRLAASVSLAGRELVLHVRDEHALFPVSIDPFLQSAKLTPEEESGKSEFGASVALSRDGDTAIVGGPWDEAHAGAAWVFTRSGGAWSQQGPKLTGSEEAGQAEFGGSVAISGDGATALVGGHGDSADDGAAWVFTRDGATWSQQGPKLTATEAIGSEPQFGQSAALSYDGNTALVGGFGDNGLTGAGWIFTRTGSTWSHGEKLTPLGGSGQSEAGFSAALSGNATLALLGAPGDNSSTGAAWMFTRTGAGWTQQKLTTPEATEGTELGYSVSLQALGRRALVGGFENASLVGAAWEFGGSESEPFSQLGAALRPADHEGASRFGTAVAQSNIGGVWLIGGPFDAAGRGAAWLFGQAWPYVPTTGTIAQLGPKLTPGDEEGAAQFGSSVALSDDGATALVGGSQDHEQLGAVWALGDAPPVPQTGPATEVTSYGAKLTGTIPSSAGNPFFHYYFQYGPTSSYGARAGGLLTPAFWGTEVPFGVAPPASMLTPFTLASTAGALPAGSTFHYRLVLENSAGTRYGADRTFTTLAGASAASTPPVLTRARQAHRIWRRGARLARISRAKRLPVGTTFRFSLDEPASVTFSFRRRVEGRSVKGRCVARTKHNRRRPRCRRTLQRGSLVFAGHAGEHAVAFQGRISRARRLAPGGYVLVITAVNPAGQRSRAAHLSFTIAP